MLKRFRDARCWKDLGATDDGKILKLSTDIDSRVANVCRNFKAMDFWQDLGAANFWK